MTSIGHKVQAALEKLFQQHRLVFWYDEQGEMQALFEHLQIPDVEKIVIDNNEFSLKYHILLEQPRQRFLLYQPQAKPQDNENWLLDLLMANYEFHTEASSLYLQDLELPQEFKTLIQEHEAFFAQPKHSNALKALLEAEDRESKIRLKMLSVLCACEPEWEKILYALFAEALKNKPDKYRSIEQYGLGPFLWEAIERKYQYRSPNASIKDFLIQVIPDNYARSVPNGKPTLNKEAYLLVNRWKENTKAKQVFYEWSQQLEKELGIRELIQNQDTATLLEADTYAIIDKKIIFDLNTHIIQHTLPNHSIQEWIDKRKLKFFYADYSYLYQALSQAAALLDEIRKVNLNISSPQEGFEKYQKQWYKIDRAYREYIFASAQAEHPDVLKNLSTQVEKAYGNSFLLPLGDHWQKAIDGLATWAIPTVLSQRQFFQHWVKPYLQRENRVFVIISDALRYESAVALRELIVQGDKYNAQLQAVLGVLPSYTQLGMAALLPHRALSFDEKSDIVYADGWSTQGSLNRSKVLQRSQAASTTISAEDFLKMKGSTEGREYIKPYQVIYIYSNHIDKTGDDKTTEGKVFEATATEFEYLQRIIQQVSKMKGSNMIITADHGYIYQHNRLDETDFTDFSPSGTLYKTNRRFVLGKNLVPHNSVQHWSGAALGFADDTEAQIPKSINRMRIQGAGSRFVHGGASLQEIVVPVLEINIARKSDVEVVEVDIISGSSNITSNSTVVSFYQKQAIVEKLLPRQLRAGFYAGSGQLISNLVSLLFNSPERDAVAREKKQNFLFTAEAATFNGEDVYLVLEEAIEGTNQYRTYKRFTYRMLIAFSSEFDDF